MIISFQLLLYIIQVKYQEDQYFCGVNFSDVMWTPAMEKKNVAPLQPRLFKLLARWPNITALFSVKKYNAKLS